MLGNTEHIDDLIAKVLAGEASPEEQELLQVWKKGSEENESYYDQSVMIFSAIEESENNLEVNVDKAWNKVMARIANDQTRVFSLFRRPGMMRMAASIILLAALSYVIYYFSSEKSSSPVIYASTISKINEKLPDGSQVILNKNSEIEFSRHGNKREVKLKGEAYFEVRHLATQEFVITIDEVMVKDIGTAFNVKAIPGSDLIEVFVEEGVVQFYSKSSEGITLSQGEKASYSRSEKMFRKWIPEETENTVSYKSMLFHFKETPLKKVVEQLNDVYGCNIVLADKALGDCKLSVTFNQESLDMVLSIICETLDLEVARNGSAIELKGETCIE